MFIASQKKKERERERNKTKYMKRAVSELSA